MQYYTIREACEELGLSRNQILQIVKSRQIVSIKGEGKSSPYKIPQTELKKLFELATSENSVEKPTIEEAKPENTREGTYNEVLQMQKILLETMRDLAATQDKIASTLAYLSKKL